MAQGSIPQFDIIVGDFSFLEDWDDRYKYLIDLGRHLPPYPDDARDETHRIRGCASQVWMTHQATADDGSIHIYADSDAHIVRGLIALLLSLYSGKTRPEISAIDPAEALAPLDLRDHLTPQRSNGFASMIKAIQAIANTPSGRAANDD